MIERIDGSGPLEQVRRHSVSCHRVSYNFIRLRRGNQ